MFTYFYRIYDRYNQKITALAIYTGDKVPSNYDKYEYNFLGTVNTYKFNSYKITSAAEDDLLKSKNPFSLVILTSQYLLKSKNDFDQRYLFKRKLIKLAKDREYEDLEIVSLLRFIDLILKLPEKLEIKFEQEIIQTYIKSKDMVLRQSERFANQLHLALYGESLEDKIKKETIMEKTLIVRNLLLLETLTVTQIAEAVNETVEFIEKIKQSLRKG